MPAGTGFWRTACISGQRATGRRISRHFDWRSSACDPNVLSKRGATLLHDVAASRGGLTSSDRLTYARLLLDAGARLDVRDDLLRSTPLGWACRWGRTELVPLFLANGADPVEPDAEPWATPMAWAEKMNHGDVAALLR